MVSDAQQRAARAVRRALACVGQLAVLSGSRLRLLDPAACGAAGVEEDLADALGDGVGAGLRLLTGSGLERAAELRRQLSGRRPQSEAAQQLSARAEALAGGLEAVLTAWRAEEPAGRGALGEALGRAPAMWELARRVEQALDAALAAREGRHGDAGALRPCVERVCVLAEDVGADSCAGSLRELASAAKALLLCFEAEDGPGPWASRHGDGRAGGRSPGARAAGGTQWL